MNWDKVKNLLILLLVILNCFLFITMKRTAIEDRYDKVLSEDIIKILAKRGINIECELPEIKGPAQLLHLGAAGIEKETVLSVLLNYDLPYDDTKTEFENNRKKVAFLSRQFNHFYYVDQSDKTERILEVTQKKEITNYVLNYLASLGIVWDDYTVTQFSVNEQQTVAEIRITQNFQGNLVYDNFINAILSATGFVYVETSCYQINGMESTEQGMILKPHQVLLKFFTTGSVTSKVVGIDQGFKKSSLFDPESVSEEQAGLCWRIMTEEGIVYYASLMNGQEVK